MLAAAIYTPAPEKDDSREFVVEAVDMPPKKQKSPEEKAKIETYSVDNIMPTADELPSFQFDRKVGSSPGSQAFDSPLPNVPRRAGADVNPDRMFRAPSTRTVERGKRRDSTGRLKFVRPSDKPGQYSSAARDILPERGKGRISAGKTGPTSHRYVSSAPEVGTSPKLGLGPGGIKITGDVKGRPIEYWPEIPESPGKEVGTVKIKFSVTPQGIVNKILIERKLNPSLEKLAKKFVKAIKFAPLSKREKQKHQWGEIIIDFTQKRVK